MIRRNNSTTAIELQQRARLIGKPEPASGATRFDDITEKVMSHLDALDPSEWTPQMWATFKEIWKAKKSKTETPTSPAMSMSSADLKKLLDGESSNSPP